MRKLVVLAVVLVMASMGAGCGRKPEAEPVAAEPAGPDVEAIMNEIFSMAEAGRIDEAVARMDEFAAETEDSELKTRLFAESLNLLLSDGRMEEAQARYLASAQDPERLRFAHGLIEEFLYRAGDFKALEAWCVTLLGLDLPEDLTAGVMRHRVNAIRMDGRFDDVLTAVRGDVLALDADKAAGITGWLIQTLIADGNLEEATRVVALVEETCGDRSVLCRQAASARVDLALAGQTWDGLLAVVQRAAGVLDDGGLAGVVDRACRGALAAGRPDVSDALAEWVLAERKASVAAAGRAARWWVLVARERGDVGLLLDRLGAVIGMDLAQGNVAGLASVASGMLLSDGDGADAQRFIDMIDPLARAATGEQERSRYLGMLLDASFKADNFDYTIELIKGGIPQQDAEWHEVMLNKVSAHKAQRDGQIDEAVTRFRAFMKHVAEKAEDPGLVDPISGDRVTRPMILGLNARRIGDMLKGAGRGEEAAAAYEEAVRYYRQALEGLETGSREAQSVQAILDELAPGS